MEKTEQRPLWKNLLLWMSGFILDNLMWAFALIAVCFGQHWVAIMFVVAAFYERLTQIRDAVQGIQINVVVKGEK